jgi:hypothetical protein
MTDRVRKQAESAARKGAFPSQPLPNARMSGVRPFRGVMNHGASPAPKQLKKIVQAGTGQRNQPTGP